MSTSEQRAAERVPCEFPLRLFNEEASVQAVALDISRRGVRLQVPGSSLGVHRLSSLVQVARRVRAVLGDTFSADLHHKLLGNLVQKRLRPIRIGQRDWVTSDVELGCRIDAGISDDEAGMLGLVLPLVGTGEVPETLAGIAPSVREPELAPAAADVATIELSAAELVRELEAAPTPGERRFFLEGRADAHRLPFRVELDGVTAEGAVLRIPDLTALDLDGDVSDVTRFVIAFDEAYGTEITLQALAGSTDLWKGRVQLREVELPPRLEGSAVLTVAFERELSDALVSDMSAA